MKAEALFEFVKKMGPPSAVFAMWTPDTLTQTEKDFLDGKPYPGPHKALPMKDVGDGSVAVAARKTKITWDRAYVIANYGTVPAAMMAEHLGVTGDELSKYVYQLKAKGLIAKDVSAVIVKTAQYRCQYCKKRKFVYPRACQTHESQCRKNPNRKKWSRVKKPVTPPVGLDQGEEAKRLAAAGVNVMPVKPEVPPFNPDPLLADNTEKKPSFWDHFKKKEFQVPADFNPQQQFGVKAYVYHAPAREIGQISTIDMQKESVSVDFPSGLKYFTVDGAKAMYNEMMARAK
jgi:hypothetical protein